MEIICQNGQMPPPLGSLASHFCVSMLLFATPFLLVHFPPFGDKNLPSSVLH